VKENFEILQREASRERVVPCKNGINPSNLLNFFEYLSNTQNTAPVSCLHHVHFLVNKDIWVAQLIDRQSYWLDETEFESGSRQNLFLHLNTSRLAVWSTQPLLQ
jgi:hypothetical protein